MRHAAATPAEEDDLDWINAKVNAEWGHVEMLFEQLKTLKAQADEEGIRYLPLKKLPNFNHYWGKVNSSKEPAGQN